MKRSYLAGCLTILLFSATVASRAQGGSVDGTCTDSPENPTAVLFFVGITGAGMAQLRHRMRKK